MFTHRIVSIAVTLTAASAGPAIAGPGFTTRIEIAGHGLVDGGMGVDAPAIGTPNSARLTLTFPAAPRVPLTYTGLAFYSTYAPAETFGPFTMTLEDDLSGVAPTLNQVANIYYLNGRVASLFADARTFLPVGIDTDQSLSFCCDTILYHYGQFHTARGDSFYTTTLTIDRFIVTVENVPEAATWAMLIAGFGFTGAQLRTRRRAMSGA